MASTSTSTSNVTVNVLPSPGFCIKSKSIQPGVLDVPSVHEQAQGPVPIPQGLKVFVNVAWSKDVPPPLDGVEKALDFAARSRRMDLKSERDSPIYVLVSDGRPDTDKAGKPALVFDCIYNSSLKNHASKNPDFKSFLVEFALQQIEVQNSISLSRTLSTPNIASKGALEPRVASIPAKWFPSGHHHRPSLDKSPDKKLIEEVVSSPAAISGVDGPPGRVQPKGAISPHINHVETPIWIWSQEGGEIHISVQVPKLTHAAISSATLDLEPRRLTLLIPDLYALDIDLGLSDAALEQAQASVAGGAQRMQCALTLKRARELNVDRGRAEWRVKDRCLVIVA